MSVHRLRVVVCLGILHLGTKLLFQILFCVQTSLESLSPLSWELVVGA